jgi:hypothetical protein
MFNMRISSVKLIIVIMVLSYPPRSVFSAWLSSGADPFRSLGLDVIMLPPDLHCRLSIPN